MADLIKHADLAEKIHMGDNTMKTVINGNKVLVRIMVIEGEVINVDAYLWDKVNAVLKGNIFEFIMDKYK